MVGLEVVVVGIVVRVVVENDDNDDDHDGDDVGNDDDKCIKSTGLYVYIIMILLNLIHFLQDLK